MPAASRTISRDGVEFTVQGNDGFWDYFASGQWEWTTIEAADAILQPGGRLLDIGAWVGPLTLWEARRGVHVVAVEPDPAAYMALDTNILLNKLSSMVRLNRRAVAPAGIQVATLYRQDGGDAYTSMMRADLGKPLVVEACTVQNLINLYGQPDLVKIDIEGAESLVLPEAGPLLRTLGIPLLLALHRHWFAPGTAEAVDRELGEWDIEDLMNQMYLLRPRL